MRENTAWRIDFHTHILPGVDDGSQSVDESIKMLRVLSESDVSHVLLTPHFYANEDDPERFIARRNRAFEKLSNALDTVSDAPDIHIIPGAEIEYFEGVACVADYPELRLGKSNLMLVEMPLGVWKSHVINDIIELNGRHGIRVVLAHVERYLFDQKKSTINTLIENGVLMQSNASFFTEKRSAGKAMRMLRRGLIHLLGSDCHNLTVRPPNLGAACDAIVKAAGEDVLAEIMQGAAYLLRADINDSKQV